MAKTPDKKTRLPWAMIRSDYKHGLSVTELCEKYGTSPSTISSRKKRDADKGEPWGDTAAQQVKKQVKKLTALAVDDDPEKYQNLSPKDEAHAIEASAIAQAAIIQGHKKGLASALVLVGQYETELSKLLQNPKRTFIIKGKPVEVDIDLEDVGKCLGHYAKAKKIFIELQRQAFDLNDKADDDEQEFEYVIE